MAIQMFSLFLYIGIWAAIYLMLMPVAEHLVNKYHPFASKEALQVYQVAYLVVIMSGLYLSMALTWW